MESTSTLPRIALIGNPNSGKSTLFNALTGKKARTGNYAGVTVGKSEASIFTPHGVKVSLLDLPGTYSLSPRSPDEAVSRDALLGDLPGAARPDAVVAVVDASQLERHLYLVTQLIDLGIPILLALNKIDAAEREGLRLDPAGLSADLGIPVVAVSATLGRGVTELKQALSGLAKGVPPVRPWQVPSHLQSALMRVEARCLEAGLRHPAAHALLLLGDIQYRSPGGASRLPEPLRQYARQLAKESVGDKEGETDTQLAAARYEFIRRALARAIRGADPARASFSDRFDRIALHPVLGWLLMGGIFATVFLSLFRWASLPMDMIDVTFGWLADQVKLSMPEGDLRDLIADGVIAGVGGVIIFLPQIIILFAFIGILEGSGYLARAAFLMDRVMGKVGLNGKAFLPLMSSYACAIPGIMAARTIENPRQRLITILVAPFQSCSARLPVYALLLAAIFPGDGMEKPMFMLGLYALGTMGAFGFAWLFDRTLPHKAAPPPFLLELPRYRLPSWREVGRSTGSAAWSFLTKAGTIILGLSILLWALATYPKSDAPDAAAKLEASAIGRIGHAIEPAVRPLGWDWQTGAAVVTSFAAREVFVGTMNILYHVEEEEGEIDATPLGERLGALFQPEEEEGDGDLLLRERMAEARHPDGSPVFTKATCASLLVFYVFAMQCIATLAATARESGRWKWAWFQFGYQSLFAVIAAFAAYRLVGWFTA
ncbi:MAG: ferrous iron transport protein B [Verrucomicrobiales bacterium]